MADISLKAVLRQASDEYRKAHPFYRWYAWFKYRMDPCYLAIAAHIPPESMTVDLGTGLGMLPVMLSLIGGRRQSLGVEHDSAKVRAARCVAAGLPDTSIAEADALSFEIPPCDVVTIVDVLHYYPEEVQRTLLARCAQSLRPGGRLLIRESDGRTGGLSEWTRGVEKLSVRFGWNKGAYACFRPIEQIMSELSGMGFSVSQVRMSGRFHPGNVLLVAEVGR